MKKNNKGFTLVELIVVIAILGVLMAVLVPQYIQYVEKSRVGVDESLIGEVAHNIEIAIASSEYVAEEISDYYATVAHTENSFIIKVSESGYLINVLDEDATKATDLYKEISKIIPDSDVEFKSNTDHYDGKTVTIHVDVNGKTSWMGVDGHTHPTDGASGLTEVA